MEKDSQFNGLIFRGNIKNGEVEKANELREYVQPFPMRGIILYRLNFRLI